MSLHAGVVKNPCPIPSRKCLVDPRMDNNQLFDLVVLVDTLSPRIVCKNILFQALTGTVVRLVAIPSTPSRPRSQAYGREMLF
jgi:hypothetical protein